MKPRMTEERLRELEAALQQPGAFARSQVVVELLDALRAERDEVRQLVRALVAAKTSEPERTL